MADRADAQITIGGEVRDLAELADAIRADNAGPEWDDHFDSRSAVIEAMMTAAEAGKPLALYCRQMAGGYVEEVQSACAMQGMAYVLDSDGYGGAWGPSRTILRDGATLELSRAGDDSPVALTAAEIRARNFADLAALLAFMDAAAADPPPLVISAAVVAAYQAEYGEA